jgi:acyl carrier protein
MTTVFAAQQVNEVRKIIMEHLDVDAEELTDHSNFREDHEADSLRMMDVVAALETRFNIEIDETRLVRMVDLHSVCTLVAELVDR